MVYRALELEATELIEERADWAGTRHRAAYRPSRQQPECMIIVVSQDGVPVVGPVGCVGGVGCAGGTGPPSGIWIV